ncbi:L,D-transpeptidase family protein [Rubritalea spongiae]|uniref:L,D-transpeptidase family protein n=1 Tax=Rubritalea spongiae TaxID=430797 RepID=A0ABW5E6P7_9BACT
MKSLLSIILVALSSLFLISCGNPYDSYYGSSSIYGGSSYLSGFEQTQPGQAPLTHNGQAAPRGYWDDEGVTGSPKIRINLHDQRAYFYKGGTLVGVAPISTGSDGHGTPRGSFKVTQKSIDHASNLYGVIKDKATGQTIVSDADTRKHKAGPGEVFVHAPMPYFMRFNGAIGMHAGFLPGYPASHGCVRLPEEMAKLFFHNASNGTPVIVD